MLKSLKKMWALILSISVLIATQSAIPFVAHAADESVWDGSSIDTGWYDPDGTEFELTSAAQLAGLSELANRDTEPVSFEGKTVKLVCDIDLGDYDWDPIGSGTDFAGLFDGGNHTVKNINLANSSENYVGFFHTVNEGTIKDLTLDNVSVGSSKQVVGGLIAMSANATIDNCHVLNSELNATYYAGGLTAYHAGGFLDVSDSSFTNGSVVAGYYAAGVVAYFKEHGNSQIIHCLVDTSDSGMIKGTYYVGGVVGWTQRLGNTPSVIEDCVMKGNIQVNGRVYAVGGIVGADTTKSLYHKLTVRNCVSFADINVNSTYYSDSIAIGGIFGNMDPVPDTARDLYVALDYCDFYGTIQTSGSGLFMSGGITGWASYNTVNNANFGHVFGDKASWAGGIAGSTTRDRMRILNSYNAGQIDPSDADCGAFCGYHGYSNAEEDDNLFIISNGYNVGCINYNGSLQTEYAIGLQFWGAIHNTFWYRSEDTVPYAFIARYENTCQTPFKYDNLGSFYGDDLDINAALSSRIYHATVKDNTPPFNVTAETPSDKNLLTVLNDEAEVKDGYLHWVVYPEDDIADSVTAEAAIPEKVEAFAKVKDYKYPMLAHTSTVRFASEEDAEMGSPVLISSAVDNDDAKVYDAAYRTVVVNPRPEGSNTVRSVTVTDGYGREVEVRDNGDGTYSYTMPRTDAIVTVAYENNFEFLDQVTLTKTYLNKDNYTGAGQILNPQGVLEENVTFSIAPYAAFNREEGRLSTAIPAFSEASYTISTGDGTDLVDADLPDYTDAGIGDYWYEVNETAGTTAGVTYDVNTYYMHVVVSREGRNHGVSQVTLHKTAPSNDGTYTNDADDKTAGFTNTFGSGSLTVTKEIIGNFADRNKTFDIAVTLTAPTGKTVTGPITYGAETIDGGWTGSKLITLQLGKGDSVTFTNIPDGVTYTVKEADYSSEGYDNPRYAFDNGTETGDSVLTGTAWEENYASGTISDSADAVTVTNPKNATIDVGVVLENAPYIIIILMVVGFGVFMLVRRRRKIVE